MIIEPMGATHFFHYNKNPNQMIFKKIRFKVLDITSLHIKLFLTINHFNKTKKHKLIFPQK